MPVNIGSRYQYNIHTISSIDKFLSNFVGPLPLIERNFMACSLYMIDRQIVAIRTNKTRMLLTDHPGDHTALLSNIHLHYILVSVSKGNYAVPIASVDEHLEAGLE
jgi:hypothetical protein